MKKMDFGTQFAVLVIWSLFSAIVTKFDNQLGKIMWIIGLGILIIFAILDLLDALELINFITSQ